MTDIKALAREIYTAEQNTEAIIPITDRYPDITSTEAYKVQLEYVKEREDNGAVVKGKKIGLTSQAMQDMLGVNQPDYGHIFDDMIYNEGDILEVNRFIKPRIEFEIAFVLKDDVNPKTVTVDNIASYVDYILPAAELIDSRIEDWRIKFEDTVADNGSSAGVILGQKHLSLSDVNLPGEKMEIIKNGEKIDEGYGSAVLGNPLKAIVWLAQSLHEYDITLRKGEVILAGSLTKAMDVATGDRFEAYFDNFGKVTTQF